MDHAIELCSGVQIKPHKMSHSPLIDIDTEIIFYVRVADKVYSPTQAAAPKFNQLVMGLKPSDSMKSSCGMPNCPKDLLQFPGGGRVLLLSGFHLNRLVDAFPQGPHVGFRKVRPRDTPQAEREGLSYV
jgi:hypothetical protein